MTSNIVFIIPIKCKYDAYLYVLYFYRAFLLESKVSVC